MSDVRYAGRMEKDTSTTGNQKGLILLLTLWLLLSTMREAFDLIGKLWISVVFDLFQILACILGLFALCQRCPVLIVVFSLTTLISVSYNAVVIAWYSNLLDGWERTQPLLSAGLPFGHSFFLRHTPLCESHFNLSDSRWEQSAKCALPYYVVEILQAALHLSIAGGALITSVVAFVRVSRQEERGGGTGTSSVFSVVSKPLPNGNLRPNNLNDVHHLRNPAGRAKSKSALKSHTNSDPVDGGLPASIVGAITAPDSLNDLSSGYMNSSYDSGAELGNRTNANTKNKRSKRESPVRVKSSNEVVPPEGSYSSATTVELNGSARATNSSTDESPQSAGLPPLSVPPPPPLATRNLPLSEASPTPFLEELKRSQPYTAMIPRVPPLRRGDHLDRAKGVHRMSERKGVAAHDFAYGSGAGGSNRIYAKNTTAPNYLASSAIGRHQLRSSQGRAKPEETVKEDSLSSEYLFPNQINGGSSQGSRRIKRLPLNGIERENWQPLQGTTHLSDYFAATTLKGNSNLTPLISFDPKRSIPLRVQEHVNSSESDLETAEEPEDRDPYASDRTFENGGEKQTTHRGHHSSPLDFKNGKTPRNDDIGDSKDSLPSIKAPVLPSTYFHRPSASLGGEGVYNPHEGESRPASRKSEQHVAAIRRRVPYGEKVQNPSSPSPALSASALEPTYQMKLPTHSSINPPLVSPDWNEAGISHPTRLYSRFSPTSRNSIHENSSSTNGLMWKELARREKSSQPSTAFPSHARSAVRLSLEALNGNNSIYDCIGNRPMASTAFPVSQYEPERLVAGISVASTVSLSKRMGDNPSALNNNASHKADLNSPNGHMMLVQPKPHNAMTPMHIHFSDRQSNPYINYPTTASYSNFPTGSTNFPSGQSAPPCNINDDGLLV